MSSPDRQVPGFEGTDRFVIESRIGQGGMGVVYRAFDRDRGAQVALKTLRKMDPGSLYRLKREFRSLADVSHPNLISLYELVSVDGQWFFTMELLEGVDFVTWVTGRLPGERRTPDATHTTETVKPRPAHTVDTVDTVDSTPGGGRPGPAGIARPPSDTWPNPDARPPPDEERVRGALRQLAEGVCALHDGGILHRDIKPSNVMVTDEGRVVLLDFGVISEAAGARWHSDVAEFVGMPVFTAPEQAHGVATEASDWYSVGVVLYETLVGRRPFRGSVSAVLKAKQTAVPPPPKLQHPDLSEDLNALCVDLLKIRPAERPPGREVLQRLGKTRAPARPAAKPSTEAALVGRATHLGQLRDAFKEARRGTGTIVFVHGDSGLGKTSLVEYFLDEIALDPDSVVLAGRCYERETVPYKALDSLVDALSRFLMALSRHEADAVMPRYMHMLARLFPVLKRVEAVAEAPRRAAEVSEPQELRRRAFAALRELLERLAQRRPLVLYIDDLQWGDADSAQLLDALMRPPEVPPLLLVASYRSDEVDRSPLLRAVFASDSPLSLAGAARQLAVKALSPDEALKLSRALLERSDIDEAALLHVAGTVARESAGNPYFIHELIRFLQADGEVHTGADLSLDVMIMTRVEALSGPARRLVEIVAVAGRPLEQQVAQVAADLELAERATLVQQLRTAQLVRLSGVRGTDFIEAYHDRIRQTVVDRLSEETLASHHLRLAEAIEVSEHPDAESLAVHFCAAGREDAAVGYARQAADQAADALAFDRAARLYRLALSLGRSEDPEREDLRRRLGDALVNAGRGGEAAGVYLEAAELTHALEAIDLRRRAAEQYLRSGYFEKGIETLRSVLEEVGLRLPSTPLRSIPALLWRRAQMRLRGLRYRERSADEIPARDLLLVDICWSACTGLGVVDPARAALFATRGLLLALAAGEPRRIGRALTAQAANHASAGNARYANKLLDRAEAIADEQDDPHVRGLAVAVRGVCVYEEGRFKEAHELGERAQTLLRGHTTGTAWELRTSQFFSLSALTYFLKSRALSALVRAHLAEAEESGDLYMSANLRTMLMPYCHLAADDPEAAYRESEQGLQRWSGHGFQVQHLFSLFTRIQADLYRGRGERALRRTIDNKKQIGRSLLLFDRALRAFWLNLRGGANLAAALVAQGRTRRRLLRAAGRDARRLGRGRKQAYVALGSLLRGGVAAARGKRQRAIAWLETAAEQLGAADMGLHAATARRRLGQVVGGDRGKAMIEEADRWLAEHEVVNPRRTTDALAPGYPAPED